jgi:hypothetical protein
MSNLADQGDTGDGPLCRPSIRKPWASPYVILSKDVRDTEAKSHAPREQSTFFSPSYSVS